MYNFARIRDEKPAMRHLATLFVALTLSATGASAQSVLERVLGEIDGASNLAKVNGTYANIAETIGRSETVAGTSSPAYWSTSDGDVVTDTQMADAFSAAQSDYITAFEDARPIVYEPPFYDPLDPMFSYPAIWKYFRNPSIPSEWVGYYSLAEAEAARTSAANTVIAGDPLLSNFTAWQAATYSFTEATTSPDVIISISSIIDGSITNIITGVTSATQEAVAGAATATEFTLPTVDLGDLSTTALGAVNTGEITLGVNSAVDEAATTMTRAISAAMTQIGGSADTGALVLNVAHNASAVNGAIQNTMIAVNGSIGSASTTALGAVNTGAITSGVNAAVQGIVGMSGQASSGL